MTRKSQDNNVVNKLNNVANNINNNVRNVVQNELLINTIRVLIIIYIAFGIPLMKDKHLNVANDNIVRLVIVALIVYLSFMDIVTAILLAIAFIVTIHHSSKSHSNNEKINTVNDVKALVDKVNNIMQTIKKVMKIMKKQMKPRIILNQKTQISKQSMIQLTY